MSSYLFAIPDGGGTTPPQLSVAASMAARGHHVRVQCDPVLEPEVDQIGARHVPWNRGPHRFVRSIETEPVSAWEARTPLGAFARFRDEVMFGPASAYAEDVLEELAREPADAVVSDLVLVGAQIAAEASKLPLAVLMTTIYPLPAPGLPPLGPGFMPAKGPLGRRRDATVAALQRRMWNGGPAPSTQPVGITASLRWPRRWISRSERTGPLSSPAARSISQLRSSHRESATSARVSTIRDG